MMLTQKKLFKNLFFLIFILLLFINLKLIQNISLIEQNNTSKLPLKSPFISEYDNTSLSLDWIRLWGEGGTYKDPLGYTRSHYGHEIAIDSNDNIYFVGDTSLGNGKNDFCVVKYDSEGNELWNQTWGGSRYDYAMGVAIDSNDNVYVAGTYHKYYFDQPEGGDMAVIKYSSSGSKIWERTYGGSNNDECNGIAIDSNDNIYLAGTREMDPNDIFLVVKYDSFGSVKWSRTFGGQFPDICSDVAIDAFDNIYLVGRTNSFGAGFNYLLVKYNKYGTKLWHKVWDADVYSADHGSEITIDSFNNVYIVGFSDDPENPREVSLVKYTSSGTFQWARSWRGGNYVKDEYYDCGAITTGLDDNIYVTSLQKNLWVYNSSGDLQGTLNYYSSDMGTPSAMAFDSYGNLYIGGKKSTSHLYYKLSLVKYKIRTPVIDIITPTPNSLYGKVSPEFELSIYEPDLNATWYNLNDGLNYTFSSLSSFIDQVAWDACGNGTVTIRFYANNSDGDTALKEVTLSKDIINPEISIVFPNNNELFGNTPPGFEVSIIDPNLDLTWYSLNNGLNYTFFNTSGFIDQEAWDVCGNGTVMIRFYANDTVGNIDYDVIIVRKNTYVPEIIILTPNPLELFADNPPAFELSIIEPNLDRTWYSLNGGPDHFFSEFSGIIDQSAWDLCGNGTVIIKFNVNNSAGNLGFEEVIVQKDIISPEIFIISPSPYELFGNATLGFVLLINEPHLNTTWYSLNNGIKHTFSGISGIINQEAWDACGNGTVTISFYANDTMGHITATEVTVRKDIIAPIWNLAPQDQFIEFGEDLNYQLDAIDPSGITNWGVNDTTVFSISTNGLITNVIMLSVKVYYLEVKAYDPTGNYCNASINIIVQDTTAPTWDVIPTDQFVEFGDDLNYGLDSYDLSGIDYWWINDTSYFNVSQNGLIFNMFNLPVGKYWIEIRAYDPYDHYCQVQLMINVSDTLAPTWDELPINKYVEFGDNFFYNLSASDLSGIDHWWISDPLIFNISNDGLITNNLALSVGIYWLEIRAYDPYMHYCGATIMINVSDTINPSWDELPINKYVEFGDNFFYNLGASDLSGIDHWWISDPLIFNISNDGLITNNLALSVGIYWLEIRAYDPYMHYCGATIMINVSDTINPSWDEIPTDQYIRLGDDFYYEVNASDLSRIDNWWISDTSNFYINNQGLITNRVALSVGNYWLEIRAYDPYGHYCSINIKITVTQVANSQSVSGYNVFALVGVCCIITLIIIKKKRDKIKA